MRRTELGTIAAAGLCVLICGCPADIFPASAPATLSDADRIRNDTNLTINERRQELAALGFSSDTINVLLREQRLGNQSGGDLRSAYDKVSGDQLSTLTPDEAQIYADEAGEVDPEITVSFSDLQAGDLVQWWKDRGIDARSDLEAALDDGAIAGTVPASLSADDIRAVFVTFDPEQLIGRLP